MAVFTHPCGEGLGVLLLVAEGAGLGLGAGLEPAEESSAREISGCSSTRDRGEDRRFSPGVGVDPELEPLAADLGLKLRVCHIKVLTYNSVFGTI